MEGGELVLNAIKLEGMGTSQFYERISEHPEMVEALRKARMAKGLEILEAEAYRRAIEGVVQPVYRGGKLVGEVRQYSERLLMVLLKAQAPEKYGKPRGKNDELTEEEEAARRTDLVARLRENNEINRKLVEEFVARGKQLEAEEAASKQDWETRRLGERGAGWEHRGTNAGRGDNTRRGDRETGRHGEGGSLRSVERGERRKRRHWREPGSP